MNDLDYAFPYDEFRQVKHTSKKFTQYGSSWVQEIIGFNYKVQRKYRIFINGEYVRDEWRYLPEVNEENIKDE